MASAFAEAITASVISTMDPTVAMQRDAIKAFVETQRSEALVKKSDAVASIGALLQKSVDDGAETTIITAYQKLLSQLTA